MKTRVLQLCHDYGGPFVTVCRQYVEGFDGAEVTTIFVQGEDSARVREEVGGESVLFLEQPGENLRGFKVSQILRLNKLLGDRTFDVVVAHRYKAIYLAGILSYFRHFPMILGVAHEHRVFKRITRKLFVTFWRRNIVLAGVSKSVVDDIVSCCPSVKRSNRIHCLSNVLPSAFVNHMIERGQARASFRLQQDDDVIGSIGRLVKKKSLPTLVKAFALVAKDNTRAKLVLVGDGPMRAELEALSADLGVSDRVIFLGHVTNAGLSASALDLFVLPSGDAEAFGIVLLEAMMAKVPVITSQAPGPSEVVDKTEWQFATNNEVDLANKINIAFALSVESRLELVEDNYRRVVEQYSPESFREQLHHIVEQYLRPSTAT